MRVAAWSFALALPLVGSVPRAMAQDEAAPAPTQPAPLPEPTPEQLTELGPYEGRVIREIRIQRPVRPAPSVPGAQPAPPPSATPPTPPAYESLPPDLQQLVRNNIRSAVGDDFRTRTVVQDTARLNRLGRFREVQNFVQLQNDGSVVVIYNVTPQPVITAVDVAGNYRLSTETITEAVKDRLGLLSGLAVDENLIKSAQRRIQDLYRSKGYYLVDVSVDRKLLEETGELVFVIREGERVKVSLIKFEGNLSFTPRELRTAVKTTTSNIFEKGPLDDDTLDEDVASLARFYKDRGYLDVRTDRQVTPSPNGREAIVTFIISEGRVYTLRTVRVQVLTQSRGVFPTEAEARGAAGPEGFVDPIPVTDAQGSRTDYHAYGPGVFTPAQITGLMEVKPGDVYSVNKLDKSVETIRNAYGKLGYVVDRAPPYSPLPALIERSEERNVPGEPLVDLVLIIREGLRFRVGELIIGGNSYTKQNVIRRQIQIKPERPLDYPALVESQRRLEDTELFAPRSVKLTTQQPDPAEPDHRDVLVEVAETNTGKFNIGVLVGSDNGLTGQIGLQQRNFDLFDTPDSFGEFISGRAFRGAGQTFNINLQPGTRVQDYSIGLSDPYVLDTDYSASGGLSYFRRAYTQYDEERMGGRVGVGRRFGSRWQGDLTVRAESVELRNLTEDAPVDVFDVADRHTITGLAARLVRSTIPAGERAFPSRGSHIALGVEQVGALGGDFTFNKLTAEHSVFLNLHESFLGYKTVLSLNTKINYIPQSVSKVPVYERYYLGGQSFRGFGYRAVSPLGIQHNTGTLGTEPVGGTWSFFFGPEIKQPIFRDIISVVGFMDTGTVADKVTLSGYSVSVGVGLSFYIRELSPAPLAFDFGFPVIKQDTDRKRLFSFSIDLPY
jgi:outer membrane protein insertion porin family